MQEKNMVQLWLQSYYTNTQVYLQLWSVNRASDTLGGIKGLNPTAQVRAELQDSGQVSDHPFLKGFMCQTALRYSLSQQHCKKSSLCIHFLPFSAFTFPTPCVMIAESPDLLLLLSTRWTNEQEPLKL